MRYEGRYCYCEDELRVHEAVITGKSLRLDYDEDEDRFLVSATSYDGCHYQGRYELVGYPLGTRGGRVELIRFVNKQKRVVLLGSYCEDDTGEEGSWLFDLEIAPK